MEQDDNELKKQCILGIEVSFKVVLKVLFEGSETHSY